MSTIYTDILHAKSNDQKLLAILLDPDKLTIAAVPNLMEKINQSPATHILVGGSSFQGKHLSDLVVAIKQRSRLPILLFPGHPSQISGEADGLLFLQLLSGRNPDYLIQHQVDAVPMLEKTNLEVISTGYILIESGIETAVERVSQTQPLAREDFHYAAQTAKAGTLIGNQLIYLEAGSGAQQPIPTAMIAIVAQRISVPLIVGGGIRSKKEIDQAFAAGADMVVIGTAFEKDTDFFQHQYEQAKIKTC
ncbi:geranylgeranylglyceryl/heptaprenylglyceryl phosphate synthase [Flavobacterium sedimenticola]|uniref:Geranylgeranylglyceryl phosphate synthase n=1 Tax=Flavobacterium sedimenticola TaxID=3043286 RepID=A0ABT6XLA2_9FLAO|nr:geranylgeranylglyceryl/heptaprenylglyceryl phosphate synthase [Flavobacterium sedimenticola]MDI9255864.1 geranylgeranylglyceryl/heptaprenylglyceryl phosphate synthase [Flavobacterium sedimenticola]